jgi:hypothetical protein
MHFQPFHVHEMEVNWNLRQKVEGWNTNFRKWKGIWIYKKSLNKFPF